MRSHHFAFFNCQFDFFNELHSVRTLTAPCVSSASASIFFFLNHTCISPFQLGLQVRSQPFQSLQRQPCFQDPTDFPTGWIIFELANEFQLFQFAKLPTQKSIDSHFVCLRWDERLPNLE